jgi:hypothetical protein
MNLLQRMAKGLQQFLAPQPRSTYSGPLQVQNLTRGTVLAVRLEAAHTGPSRRKGLLGATAFNPAMDSGFLPANQCTHSS